METLTIRVKNCEDRIEKLERYCEEYKNRTNENKVDLAKAITKIEDLINTVEKLPENLESSMLKSIELQAKEHEKIYNEIKELKKDNEDNKKELEDLKKLIDERTIVKDSKNYQKYIFEIVKYIIIAIIGFVVALVLK